MEHFLVHKTISSLNKDRLNTEMECLCILKGLIDSIGFLGHGSKKHSSTTSTKIV